MELSQEKLLGQPILTLKNILLERKELEYGKTEYECKRF